MRKGILWALAAIASVILIGVLVEPRRHGREAPDWSEPAPRVATPARTQAEMAADTVWFGLDVDEISRKPDSSSDKPYGGKIDQSSIQPGTVRGGSMPIPAGGVIVSDVYRLKPPTGWDFAAYVRRRVEGNVPAGMATQTLVVARRRFETPVQAKEASEKAIRAIESRFPGSKARRFGTPASDRREASYSGGSIEFGGDGEPRSPRLQSVRVMGDDRIVSIIVNLNAKEPRT